MMRNRRKCIQRFPASQRGVVLVTALVFLVILTLLGITSMSTNILEEKMAANSQDINRAFQAAESSITTAFNSGTAFTGTIAGDTDTATDADLGTYGADSSFQSYYLDSGVDSGYMELDQASSEGLFKWYYYEVEGTGETQSGASSTVVVGAKVLGQ